MCYKLAEKRYKKGLFFASEYADLLWLNEWLKNLWYVNKGVLFGVAGNSRIIGNSKGLCRHETSL